MQLSDFRIGLEFFCGDQRWRCTDVGTRVITAIKLGARMVARTTTGGKVTHVITDDPSWLDGPPYAVAEHVFDEYDQEACTLEAGSLDMAASQA